MVKAIILDVDGVIVGEKIGYNSPNPHPDVIKALREVHPKGIPIALCTAKPHFAISQIIEDAGLDNLHITDGGAVAGRKKHVIDTAIAQEVIKVLLKENVYTEFYTVDDYFIQSSQRSPITKQHTHILQREPKVVGSLSDEVAKHEPTKIMPIARDETDKQRVAQLLQPFANRLQISWGVHPVALPLQFGIVTALGISKKEGAMEISKSTNISLDDFLGVGDSISDWQFMEVCGYGAAMGNASGELKEKVKTKGDGKFYIGPGVDENGIIEILNFFISQQ